MDQAERDRMQAELRKHGELKATPVKHKEAAGVADFLKRVHKFAGKPFGLNNPPGEMLSELLSIPALASTLERVAYGEPLTTGAGMTAKPRAETMEAAMAVAPLAQMTRGLPVGASTKTVKEQPMLQGFYRGYAGERGEPGEIFASPQRAVAEYYANKRSAQTGGEPNIEMVLADPSAGKAYGHSTRGTGAEPPLTTMARKLAAGDVQATTPLGSLREQNFQRFIDPSVERGRFYHGTGEDIRAFDPDAGEIGHEVPTFVSPDPSFASGFYNRRPSTADELWEAGITQEFPQHGANVMPVHVQVRNPFDYSNEAHVEALHKAMTEHPLIGPDFAFSKKRLSSGDWAALEDPTILELLKALGHDAMYVSEGGVKNLGIFDPRRIKSAIGNRGTYDIKEPDITKADGGSVSIPDDFTAPDMSDGGRALPDPDYMRLALQQSR